MRKQFYLVVLIVAVCFGVYYGIFQERGGVEPLKMAILPGEDPAVELEKMKPMADYLAEQIGRPIDLKVASDYTAVIIALQTGDVDMARISAFGYILAVQEAEVTPLVRAVKKKSGTDVYHSIIIVRADSGIETLEDLKGKSFAFVDVTSTSGHLVPRSVLSQVGIDPETDFSETFFAGSHDSVWLAVKNGTVDAGSTNDWRFYPALESGELFEPGEISVIATSDSIPHSPIVVRDGLSEDLKEELKDIWLNMPEQLTVDAWGVLRYVEAVDSDYDGVREVAKVLDLDLTQME